MKNFKKENIKNYISKLRSNGYLIVNDVFNQKKCITLKNDLISIYKKLDKKHDIEGKKVGQIIIRDLVLIDPDKFLNLIDFNLINKIAMGIFRDEYILENIMASNSINVNNQYKRIAHIDGHLPVNDVNLTTDLVAIICLDNFTKKNGATKIWPKSHLSGIHIHKNGNKKFLKNKKYTLLNAKKGSVGFILGQTWHQIGENITTDSRWSIIIHYKRWWIKPSTDFTKCGTAIFNKLNPMQKKLLGFTSISPKFNLKKLKRNHKTLRKIEKVPNEYKKSLNY